jgi:hypothetical protein
LRLDSRKQRHHKAKGKDLFHIGLIDVQKYEKRLPYASNGCKALTYWYHLKFRSQLQIFRIFLQSAFLLFARPARPNNC